VGQSRTDIGTAEKAHPLRNMVNKRARSQYYFSSPAIQGKAQKLLSEAKFWNQQHKQSVYAVDSKIS